MLVNKKLLVKRINITACNVIYEEYAKDIGADYYSKDAKSAVEIAKLNFN